MNYTLIYGSTNSFIADYSSIIFTVDEKNLRSYYISQPAIYSNIDQHEGQ
jgi:hypothetical protein